MDVVLVVGLPGAARASWGKRLAAAPRATFIDLDEGIETRRRPLDPGHLRDRGRGGVPAPSARRSRAWARRLRGRLRARHRDRRRGRSSTRATAGRCSVAGSGLARRPARGPRAASAPSAHVRPLIAGATRSARSAPSPRSGSASTRPPIRVNGVAEVSGVMEIVDGLVAPDRRGARCCCAETPIGRVVLGEGIAAGASLVEACGAPCRARSSSRSRCVGGPWDGSRRRCATRARPRRRVLLPRARPPSAGVVEDGGARPGRLRVERPRTARRDRRRCARRLPGSWRRLPPRRAGDPRPDDARGPDRLVDRRQDRRGPARGQEPGRGVPPAGRDRHRHRVPATLPERSGERRWARP